MVSILLRKELHVFHLSCLVDDLYSKNEVSMAVMKIPFIGEGYGQLFLLP